MTEESRLDSYFEALRDDLPSSGDEARMRRRLASAGVAVTLAAAGQTAAAGSTVASSAAAGSTTVATSTVAGSTAVAKVGLVSALSMRFATLPLLAQLGMVTAGTTAIASGPVAIALHAHRSSAAATGRNLRASAEPQPQQNSSLVVAARATEPQAEVISQRRDDAEAVHDARPTGAAPRGATPAEPAAMPRDSRAADAAIEGGLAVTANKPTASPFHETTPVQDCPPALAAIANGSRDTNLVSPPVTRYPLDDRNLSEETRLIDHALAAIRARDLTLAARLLDEHATRFPHARLWREQQRVRQKLEEAHNRAETP